MTLPHSRPQQLQTVRTLENAQPQKRQAQQQRLTQILFARSVTRRIQSLQFRTDGNLAGNRTIGRLIVPDSGRILHKRTDHGGRGNSLHSDDRVEETRCQELSQEQDWGWFLGRWRVRFLLGVTGRMVELDLALGHCQRSHRRHLGQLNADIDGGRCSLGSLVGNTGRLEYVGIGLRNTLDDLPHGLDKLKDVHPLFGNRVERPID